MNSNNFKTPLEHRFKSSQLYTQENRAQNPIEELSKSLTDSLVKSFEELEESIGINESMLLSQSQVVQNQIVQDQTRKQIIILKNGELDFNIIPEKIILLQNKVSEFEHLIQRYEGMNFTPFSQSILSKYHLFLTSGLKNDEEFEALLAELQNEICERLSLLLKRDFKNINEVFRYLEDNQPIEKEKYNSLYLEQLELAKDNKVLAKDKEILEVKVNELEDELEREYKMHENYVRRKETEGEKVNRKLLLKIQALQRKLKDLNCSYDPEMDPEFASICKCLETEPNEVDDYLIDELEALKKKNILMSEQLNESNVTASHALSETAPTPAIASKFNDSDLRKSAAQQAQIAELQQEINELSAELAHNEQEKDDVNEELRLKTEENQDILEKFVDIERDLEAEEQGYLELREELEQQEHESRELQEELSKKEEMEVLTDKLIKDQKDTYIAELDQKTEEIEERMKQNEQLQEQIDILNKHIENAAFLNEQESNSQCNKQKLRYQKKQDLIIRSITQEITSIKDVKGSISELREEYFDGINNLQQQEWQKHIFSLANYICQKQEIRLIELQGEKNKLLSENQALESQLQQINIRIGSVQQENSALQEEVAQANSQCVSARNQEQRDIDEAVSKHTAELAEKDSEIQQLKAQLQNAQNDNCQLVQQEQLLREQRDLAASLRSQSQEEANRTRLEILAVQNGVKEFRLLIGEFNQAFEELIAYTADSLLHYVTNREKYLTQRLELEEQGNEQKIRLLIKQHEQLVQEQVAKKIELHKLDISTLRKTILAQMQANYEGNVTQIRTLYYSVRSTQLKEIEERENNIEEMKNIVLKKEAILNEILDATNSQEPILYISQLKQQQTQLNDFLQQENLESLCHLKEEYVGLQKFKESSLLRNEELEEELNCFPDLSAGSTNEKIQTIFSLVKNLEREVPFTDISACAETITKLKTEAAQSTELYHKICSIVKADNTTDEATLLDLLEQEEDSISLIDEETWEEGQEQQASTPKRVQEYIANHSKQARIIEELTECLECEEVGIMSRIQELLSQEHDEELAVVEEEQSKEELQELCVLVEQHKKQYEPLGLPSAIEYLEDSFLDLVSQIKEKETQLEQEYGKAEEATALLSNEQEELAEESNELLEYQEEISELEASILSLREGNIDLEALIDKLQAENASLIKEHELATQIKEMVNNNFGSVNENEVINRLMASLEESSTLEFEVSTKQQQLSRAEAELAEKQELIVQQKDSILTLSNTIKLLDKKYEEAIQQVAEYSNDSNVSPLTIRELKIELEAKESSNNELQEQLVQSLSQISELSKQLEQYANDKEELMSTLQKQKEAFEVEMQNSINPKELEDIKDENSVLKQKLSSYEAKPLQASADILYDLRSIKKLIYDIFALENRIFEKGELKQAVDRLATVCFKLEYNNENTKIVNDNEDKQFSLMIKEKIYARELEKSVGNEEKMQLKLSDYIQ